MKVFISHSSRDKWIARKLSEELVGMGCITFLDEKDIATGESIDDSIQGHLEESEDFLLLLSPDSIKSQWVLIELGGALALKKRIVIILLYLGANDIPQPISKYLARDINDIDRYYAELKKRIEGTYKAPPQKKKKPSKPSKRSFDVGDHVRIAAVPQQRTTQMVGWNSVGGMDMYCGILSTITYIDSDLQAVKVEEDDGNWWWAFEWLTREG